MTYVKILLSNRGRRAGKLLLLVGAVVSLTLSSVKATTMVPANLAQLAEAAESAFVVKIDAVESTTTDAGRSFDVIRGTVTEPVFGNPQTSQSISWNQFRLSQRVMLPAMPKYEAGKEYLIFLTGKGPGTGFQSPVGLGQGTFLIMRNPQTGAAYARNAYRNASLTLGMNVEAAARDMVEGNAAKRRLPAAQKEAEAKRISSQLRGRQSHSLSLLKEAAQFFHDKKKAGRTPSTDYLTTRPANLVR